MTTETDPLAAKTPLTDQPAAAATLDGKSPAVTQPSHIKSIDEIEAEKLNLERERLELQRTIETAKLGFEKSKLEHEHKFWNRNSGVLITGLISLAAVMVTLGQVWSTSITQKEQMKIAEFQKNREIEMIDRQKEKELSLSAAKFVADNRKVLFEGSAQEKELMAKIIGIIYPPPVAASLLAKLENASSPPEESTWRKERERIVRPTAPANRSNPPPLKRLPETATRESAGNTPANRYVSDKTNGCPSSVTHIVSGTRHSCYLSASDADYCYYDCYPSEQPTSTPTPTIK